MTILPTDALIVVDVQKDFCSGGALAVHDAEAIVPVINRLLPHFDCVVYTRDWHPPYHASFETEGGPWPIHCVQGTRGAEFHPAMSGAKYWKGAIVMMRVPLVVAKALRPKNLPKSFGREQNVC